MDIELARLEEVACKDGAHRENLAIRQMYDVGHSYDSIGNGIDIDNDIELFREVIVVVVVASCLFVCQSSAEASSASYRGAKSTSNRGLRELHPHI